MNDINTIPELPEGIFSKGCPILGVGASAGGLEAFQALITTMKPDSDLALVLVQHLDPDHESLLNELLTRRAHVPVLSIEDGMVIEAGKIYIIPPGSELKVEGYTMRLTTFEEPRGLRRPIDSFFESLARNHGGNAAGIVLSGTGSDGSVGVRAIKQAGGLVLVQDATQSKYDGMPRSAIATGAADLIVPAEDMVDVATDYFRHNADVSPELADDKELIARVTKHVLYRTGHDFSHYKPATLLRRIARRMSVLNLSEASKYPQRLISDPDEADRLLNDFLINVTYFFRDPQVFDEVRKTVIPAMLLGKGKGDEVRIWVAGCSTGQEAYSLAMLLATEMDRLDVTPSVNIFATDIDDNALKVARAGLYPSSIAEEVPEEFLERFFTVTAEGYEVGSELRAMVRFSKHNFTKDAPFSRLDMISCRNTVIYFDRWLQDQVMSIFHYALKPHAYLVLGPSEHLGVAANLFEVQASSLKIFRRLEGQARSLSLPLAGSTSLGKGVNESAGRSKQKPKTLEVQINEVVAQRHAPPFVVVDRNDLIAHFSNGIDRYLKLKAGAPNLNVLDLIRPEMRPPLRRLLSMAQQKKEVAQMVEWAGELDGETIGMTFSVDPVGHDGYRLLTFREHADIIMVPSKADGDAALFSIDYDYVQTLEDELDIARQTVRTTVEELETSNEELKSSNEEMMAMNEELQSANEELTTVNDELQIKVRELDEAYSDLRNFVESTNIATFFLDETLMIRRFTPEVRNYFRVTEKDHGRSFSDLANDLDADSISRMCEKVLETGKPQEVEQQTADGESELRISVLPYKTMNEQHAGVVVLFVPITELKRYSRELEGLKLSAERSLAEIEEIYRVSPQAMALMAPDLTYLRVNQRLADVNGKPIEAHYGKTIAEIVPDLSDQTVGPVKQVFETGKPILNQSVTGKTAASPDETRHWEVNWYPIFDGEAVTAVGVNVQDVTGYHQMSEELRRVMRELQHRVKNMLSNVISLVNMAGRDEGEPQAVYETLVNRIHALSKTHNLLTETNWQGTSLREILELELVEVYGQERVTLRGPDVHMTAKASVALGMTIHEMATNAAKYGALSVDTGQLSVLWSKLDEGDGEHIILKWNEQGGPEAKEPDRIGFGTQLIQSTISGSLGGAVERDYGPGGITCTIKLPVKRLRREEISDRLH